MKKLLTAYEMADILDLSVETIWRYTRQEKIPVIKLGAKQYRYEKEAVLDALTVDGNLVREERSVYSKQGEYTYEDYLKLPEEPGYRYEILEGYLVKDPSPSIQHQRVSRELEFELKKYFDEFDPKGEIFDAPLDVTLNDGNVVQPDIIYISSDNRDIMRKERIDGPCSLAIEIMSPSNHRKDRLRKMEIYRKVGIPHYWLLDPEENILEAYMLEGENYLLIFTGGPEDDFTHPEFPGLNLDLAKVFYRPDLG